MHSEAIVASLLVIAFFVGVFVGARYFDLVTPEEEEKP
jgi:hypothetical protein